VDQYCGVQGSVAKGPDTGFNRALLFGRPIRFADPRTSEKALTTSDLKQRIQVTAGIDAETDTDSMIGFFQKFRPDGQGLQGLFDGLPRGEQYRDRLDRLFQAAGEDRRESGGRDAYFVVRQPPAISPEVAEFHATRWLESLRRMALRVKQPELSGCLNSLPRIRVLEGNPPKQPKRDQESFPLLKAIKVHGASLTDGIAGECQVVSLLREAYYFIACDWVIRDYLLWPAYANELDESDPMAGYFELWRHGVKLRVFHDDMVDLYLPR
jgi:hypothetical protein